MEGRLVKDHSRNVCISCYHWNCWHERGQPCDIRGCECTTGGRPVTNGREQWSKALANQAAAKRRGRTQRKGPEITGIVKLPPS